MTAVRFFDQARLDEQYLLGGQIFHFLARNLRAGRYSPMSSLTCQVKFSSTPATAIGISIGRMMI